MVTSGPNEPSRDNADILLLSLAKYSFYGVDVRQCRKFSIRTMIAYPSHAGYKWRATNFQIMKLIMTVSIISFGLLTYHAKKTELSLLKENNSLKEQIKDTLTQYNSQVEVLSYYQRLVNDKRCQGNWVPLKEEK